MLRAIVSWTWVLTRWSGRPKTIATAINAGASSRTTSSSVGLSVNRITTEPTSPMIDDNRLVTVWVSIVRTSVTSFDRREMSSPTRRLAWKSSDRVISRPKSSPRSWATTRSPTTPSRYVCTNPPTACTQNSPMSITISWSSPPASPPATTSVVMPGDDQGERQADRRRDDEADQGDGERAPVRSEVAEQPAPRHAAEAADLANDGPSVRGDPRELLGHARDDVTRRRQPPRLGSDRLPQLDVLHRDEAALDCAEGARVDPQMRRAREGEAPRRRRHAARRGLGGTR